MATRGTQRNTKLLPAYLAVGADELKRNESVSRLKRYLEGGLEAFNLDELTASAEMEPSGVVASLNTLPMGTPFRLVIIHQADRLPKAVSEAIVSYLADPNEGCVLLMEAESLSRGTRLYKAVAKLGKTAIIDCAAKKSWELPGYVAKRAHTRLGIEIDQDAARELVDRVGDNTTMLDRQLKNLKELCPHAGRITRADVEKHVARVAEVKPWGLIDAVSERNAAKALELYGLMRNPSEIMLLSLVTTRVKELICAQSLERRGRIADLGRELNKRDWQVKNHRRYAARFGEGELEHALMACAECDEKLKTGADARTAFTLLVLQICGAAPK